MTDVTTSTIPSATVNYNVTQDIQPGWLNVVRRLQSVAWRGNHYGIVSIKVLVDRDGNPVQWTEPKRMGIEPGSSQWLDKLLENLTSD